ncbi:MAG: carboxypeptidase-like regulatory domain-containing protein, partial [Bryobacteraceae bacterium]
MVSLLVPLVLAQSGTAQSGMERIRHSAVVRSLGQPIPGAAVTVEQAGRKIVTVTDASGLYEFTSLTQGKATIEVEMVGFAASKREVEMTAGGQIVEWNLDLQPRAARQAAPPRRGPGFQNVALNQSRSSADAEPPPETDNVAPLNNPVEASANEAFLLNGSVSGGLQSAIQDSFLMERRGEFEMLRATMGAGMAMPGDPMGGPGTGMGMPGAEGQTEGGPNPMRGAGPGGRGPGMGPGGRGMGPGMGPG